MLGPVLPLQAQGANPQGECPCPHGQHVVQTEATEPPEAPQGADSPSGWTQTLNPTSPRGGGALPWARSLRMRGFVGPEASWRRRGPREGRDCSLGARRVRGFRRGMGYPHIEPPQTGGGRLRGEVARKERPYETANREGSYQALSRSRREIPSHLD